MATKDGRFSFDAANGTDDATPAKVVRGPRYSLSEMYQLVIGLIPGRRRAVIDPVNRVVDVYPTTVLPIVPGSGGAYVNTLDPDADEVNPNAKVDLAADIDEGTAQGKVQAAVRDLIATRKPGVTVKQVVDVIEGMLNGPDLTPEEKTELAHIRVLADQSGSGRISVLDARTEDTTGREMSLEQDIAVDDPADESIPLEK